MSREEELKNASDLLGWIEFEHDDIGTCLYRVFKFQGRTDYMYDFGREAAYFSDMRQVKTIAKNIKKKHPDFIASGIFDKK